MVGITKNRWLATGLSSLMAAGLVVGASAATVAQDEECPPAEVTGVLPDLTEELGRTPKVGLVMKSLANEFFQQMDNGAKAFAAENEDLFEFQTVGMKDERDFAAQVEAVENYITQEFDAIVIAPADSKAMVEPIKEALDAGIKVINKRIKSVKSTQQITKAMKMVAAAKLNRSQGRMLAARPYTRKLVKLVQHQQPDEDYPDFPAHQQRERRCRRHQRGRGCRHHQQGPDVALH